MAAAKNTQTTAGKKRERFQPGTPAFAVVDSSKKRIGTAATTFAEPRSCATSCPVCNGVGCHPERGTVGALHPKPLNAAVQSRPGATSVEVALAETAAIDGPKVSPAGCCAYTVGDCKTDERRRSSALRRSAWIVPAGLPGSGQVLASPATRAAPHGMNSLRVPKSR